MIRRPVVSCRPGPDPGATGGSPASVRSVSEHWRASRQWHPAHKLARGRVGLARALAGWAIVLLVPCVLGADARPRAAAAARTKVAIARPLAAEDGPARSEAEVPKVEPEKVMQTVTTVAIFALASLAPAAVLMLTAFVRINIVLTLLRQALGSPQVPGNQVLTALAMLLTLLVMKPVADRVYADAIAPYLSHKATPEQAWAAGSKPIKTFMIRQVYATHHERYLRDLYDYAEPPGPSRVEPTDPEQLSLRVVAPAYLMSELTTALFIGFTIYLPFLVIDLVVSAVLAAMGLVMLPPAQVAMPLKLIAFVLADGWWLVPAMLLRSFGAGGG